MRKNITYKKAVIIMGPPGSGKGTQAKLIADMFGLVVVDTGKILRAILANPTTKELKKEKQLNDAGILNSPSFVLTLLTKTVTKIAKGGDGLIFTGSPRTMYETFGDSKKTGLIDTLERLYGKSNVSIIVLAVPQKASTSRNSARRSCVTCGTQLLSVVKGVTALTRCPFCAGKLEKRVDDNARVIKTRLQEYASRTEPIIKKLKSTKRRVFVIDGTLLPYAVFDRLIKILS